MTHRRLAPMAMTAGLLVAVACGGGGGEDDGQPLTFESGRTMSAADVRSDLRGFLIGLGDQAQAFCDSLDGLTLTEVADALTAYNDQRGADPDRDMVIQDDRERVAEFTLEECDRIN